MIFARDVSRIRGDIIADTENGDWRTLRAGKRMHANLPDTETIVSRGRPIVYSVALVVATAPRADVSSSITSV